jgi:hypothetical protein
MTSMTRRTVVEDVFNKKMQLSTTTRDHRVQLKKLVLSWRTLKHTRSARIGSASDDLHDLKHTRPVVDLQKSDASSSRVPVCTSAKVSDHHSTYVSIRQHTSAYASILRHTSAYVSIRQHTSANVSKRQHTSANVS